MNAALVDHNLRATSVPARVMRAKLRIGTVHLHQGGQESLELHGVSKSTPYGDDGLDEDNTFAKFSPSVGLQITIANPALLGKFKPGQTFYVDFIPADMPAEVQPASTA